jgi:hypothetical protein
MRKRPSNNALLICCCHPSHAAELLMCNHVQHLLLVRVAVNKSVVVSGMIMRRYAAASVLQWCAATADMTITSSASSPGTNHFHMRARQRTDPVTGMHSGRGHPVCSGCLLGLSFRTRCAGKLCSSEAYATGRHRLPPLICGFAARQTRVHGTCRPVSLR